MGTSTASRNTHRPVRTHCPACGKRCYATRKVAKQQAKVLFPGQHMGVYGCDWNGYQWFHLTSEPERKKEARREVREREAFIEEALDRLYEKAIKEDAIPWNDAEDPEDYHADHTDPVIDWEEFPDEP